MEQKKFKVTFGKVTALLCALTILFGFIAFFGNNKIEQINRINEIITDIKEAIGEKEEYIVQKEEEIVTLQQELLELQLNLEEAQTQVHNAESRVTELKGQLEIAEANLDIVCYRSSYSYWYCSETCQPLHNTVTEWKNQVSDAQKVVTAAVDTLESVEYSMEKTQENIRTTEGYIEDAKARIASLEEQKKELTKESIALWLNTILCALGTLLAFAGLALLAKGFYLGEMDKFILFAVAGVAGGSFLCMISSFIGSAFFKSAALLALLTSPYLWNMAIMGLLALVLLNKTTKPVALRNTAVVFSVIMGVLLAVVNPFMGIFYMATSICIAFMIVPLVFTQYIPVAKHLFLSFITFGIWQLIWTYHVTKNLNRVEGVEIRKPACQLLLCMFLPLYYPFWLYKTAEGVEDFGKVNGKEFKIDILCIAFSFVCPLFATVLIQNKINVVVGQPAPEEA